MAVINLAKILRGKTGWVSISSDHKKIIAQGKTLKDLIERLGRMGNPDGHIMNVAKDYSRYVG